jgi:hypothetical protein
MSDFIKVGYATSTAKGTSLKIYKGSRFIGAVSFADIERCRKSWFFVATIIKFPEQKQPKATIKEANPEKLKFGLDLF